MEVNTPTGTVLYLIEQAIKEYRKLSQYRISQIIPDITIDQCLVLIILNSTANCSQKKIAELIFKDYASITRMIELLVQKNYLERNVNQDDRRRSNLQITKTGKNALELLTPIINENRKSALSGISNLEINELQVILEKIISNCKLQ